MLLKFDFLLDVTGSEYMSVQAWMAGAGEIPKARVIQTSTKNMLMVAVLVKISTECLPYIRDSKLFQLPETPVLERC